MLSPFLIKTGTSLVMLSFGVSQILHPDPWVKEYMPGFLKKLNFVSANTLMILHGWGNLILGIIFLTGLFAKVGVVATFLWWLSILPFAFSGSWKAGARDLAITASILSLLV